MPIDVADRPDLSQILTPNLYSEVLKLSFPWDGSFDSKFVSKFYFVGEPNTSQKCFDTFHSRATKPISSLCPEVPDVRKYLPDSKDPKYPEHALGLIMLLDQVPRRIYRGFDMRYTNAFFDPICLKLTKDLIAADALPDSIEEWEKLGYSFDDAMLRKLHSYSPLSHSEDLSNHDLLKEKTEKMRKEVEEHYGLRDPARDTMDQDAQDPKLFSRLIRGGPPLDGSAADFFFYFFRVRDAHRSIVVEYGRYPYRNGVMGREATTKEREFMEATEGFGTAGLSDTDAERVRKQVEDGVWDELSDKGPQ
ncbi:hypothetical protein V5O48_004999 [Marasmius crinis-equi]|uniref:Uncharacterized protein n=1 Tax=Marasmius crinis-equi TaxID=585013 RepID=A0ABR3FNS8_9AGAR